MIRHWFSAGAAILVAAVSLSMPLAAEDSTLTWDGLVAVKAKRLDAVYLMPGADIRPYTKVMFDPTEVSLKKNWLRDYNNSSRDLSHSWKGHQMQYWTDPLNC